MSEILETLDGMYARLWRGHDLEGSLAGLPDDFEWVFPGHPDGPVLHGRDAVTDFFRDWIEQWHEPDTDWSLEQTGPDTILALVTTRGRGRASGVPVELSYAQVWTFRGHVPARMVLYADRDKGRNAAGADPPSP